MQKKKIENGFSNKAINQNHRSNCKLNLRLHQEVKVVLFKIWIDSNRTDWRKKLCFSSNLIARRHLWKFLFEKPTKTHFLISNTNTKKCWIIAKHWFVHIFNESYITRCLSILIYYKEAINELLYFCRSKFHTF